MLGEIITLSRRARLEYRAPMQLDAEELPEQAAEAKWVQVAQEGSYKGYAGGAQPFDLDGDVFDQMVANLRAHPAFVAGEDGVGTHDVISWDFHHASEASPTSGSIPLEGSPAQAWTLDLQKRIGGDGRAQLWALTRFLEPARSFIREGKYRWASIAFSLDAIDPISGASVGARISSIALTNVPFIEGMQPLAAQRDGAKHALMYWESAETREDAVKYIRELLQVEQTAETEVVLGHLAKMAAWAESGEVPEGVDFEGLIGGLRRILNLQVLSPPSEVVSEAIKAFAETPSEPPQPTVTTSRSKGMDELKALLESMGKQLKCEANRDAVVARLVELKRVEAEATDAKADAAATKERLRALAEALGVEDGEAAVAKVADLMTKAADLAKVMPELEGLRAEKKQAEDKAIEEDVDEALAASNLPGSMRNALLLARRDNPEQFAKDFPKAPKDQTPSHLQQALTSTPAGAPIQASQQQQQPGGGAAPIALSQQRSTDNGAPIVLQLTQEVNLDAMPGPNPTAKAMAFLAANFPGWADMSHEDRFEKACLFKRQPGVICSI